MKVEIEKEIVKNHTDEEIIAYLSKVMNGVVQNYQVALKANQPESLWSNLGDIAMTAAVLKTLRARNEDIEARRQSMVQ